jgi:hypothetical protein
VAFDLLHALLAAVKDGDAPLTSSQVVKMGSEGCFGLMAQTIAVLPVESMQLRGCISCVKFAPSSSPGPSPTPTAAAPSE